MICQFCRPFFWLDTENAIIHVTLYLFCATILPWEQQSKNAGKLGLNMYIAFR